MALFDLGSAISGVAGIFSDIDNRAAASRTAGRNRTHDFEAWALDNFYKSPIMERMRLEQAGINPAIYYAQNGSSGGQSLNTSPAPPPPPSDYGGHVSKALSSMLMSRSTMADVEAKEQSMELTKAQVDNSRALTAKTLVDTAKTEQDKEQSAGLYQSTLDQAEANVNKTMADTDLSVVNARKGIQDTQQSADLFPTVRKKAQLENFGKQLDNALKQLDVKYGDKRLKAEVKSKIIGNIQAWQTLSLDKQREEIQKLEVYLSQKGMSKQSVGQLAAMILSMLNKK